LLPDKQTELVRGRLIVREPPGYKHGVIAARLARLIDNHVHQHDLGTVVAAETGFKLFADPDTVRAADEPSSVATAPFILRHSATLPSRRISWSRSCRLTTAASPVPSLASGSHGRSRHCQTGEGAAWSADENDMNRA